MYYSVHMSPPPSVSNGRSLQQTGSVVKSAAMARADRVMPTLSSRNNSDGTD